MFCRQSMTAHNGSLAWMPNTGVVDSGTDAAADALRVTERHWHGIFHV
jgi:hypothetical protein